MVTIFNLIFILIFASVGFCDEAYNLEKIVVKSPGNDSQRPDSLKNNYAVQVLSGQEAREKNLNSLADLLDYVSGMDLRYRGTIGLQGDLSLRGSTYEQVAILIDGLKIMDPQTGHHNLDIPLTIFDVERIEIMKEPGAAIYGLGALAGSVNIITKKPSRQSLNLDTLFGQHALFGQAFSLSMPNENLSGRLSFDHKISKAARPNTDFNYNTLSLYLNRAFDNKELDALFGYQKKDFGADSFYSNLFPEEEEHTETVFIKLGLNSAEEFATLKNNLFLRKHRDKFILQRNNPMSVNYHTTYVYGLNSSLNIPVGCGDLLLGIDTGNEEINSTNLGKHTRPHESGSIGFIPKLTDKLSADFRARLDYYENWGAYESFNFGAGYYIFEKLKIKGSFARAFRTPSFTELYYSDAANVGNSNLKAEKSDSFNLGINFSESLIELGLDGFYRRGTNLIDWARPTTSDLWNATNLGKVDFRGIEFSSKIKTNLDYRCINLKSIVFSYNYISVDKKPTGSLSKYVLDVLKHQYIMDIYSGICGLNINCQLSYSQRYFGETYFLGNIYIGKKFKNYNFTLEPYIKIDNFSNTEYREIAGVLQPGRWIKGGLKFEW